MNRSAGGVHISESLTIFISAGEASGEQYGTLLIDALRGQLATTGQTVRFFGMGGERMATAGCERIVRSEDVAVMGITEVVRHLPRIYREFRRIKQAIRERKPDVAILIDFPDFHLKLAEELHRLNIPVIYFVSPQLWAWKKHRIKQVQRFVDRMLVIFPFEESFYRERGVNAEFVGHPLADLPLPTITRNEFATTNTLDANSIWIGLLPGSRIKEIRANLPEMLLAAKRLADNHTDQFSFLLPLAATLTPAQRGETQQLARQLGSALNIRLVDDARAALFHARASIVASGTATVEAALIGNPFVVVYRVSTLTYAIAKRVVKVPHVAMVNLIAHKRLVPELIQSEFTAEKIVAELTPLLLDGSARTSMMEQLSSIRSILRGKDFNEMSATEPSTTAIDRVAAIALEVLRESSQSQKVKT